MTDSDGNSSDSDSSTFSDSTYRYSDSDEESIPESDLEEDGEFINIMIQQCSSDKKKQCRKKITAWA